MKNFLIILYVLACGSISHANAATESGTMPATTTIMVFGDSLSASYGLSREAGWVSLLKARLHEQTPVVMINNSISGETAMGGRNRIGQALETYRPDIVIVALGGNDGLRGAPIQSIYDNLEAIIEACLRSNAKVLLAGMQLPPNYGIAYTQKFRDIYPRLAERHQVRLVPFLLEGFGEKREYFQPDGIHPNLEAQIMIMENVWEVLRLMLAPERLSAYGRTAFFN
jgi:acyl-CoA thioesterase I